MTSKEMVRHLMLFGPPETAGGRPRYSRTRLSVCPGSTTSVSGTFTGSSTPSEVEDIDPLVVAQLDDSKTANDTSNLSTIFGAAWTPIAGTENYGDLLLSSSSSSRGVCGRHLRHLVRTNGLLIVLDQELTDSGSGG